MSENSGEGEQGEALRAIHELTNNYFATEFTVNAEGILSQIHELSRAPSSTVAGAQGKKNLEKPDASSEVVEATRQKKWIRVSDQLPSGNDEVLYWDGEEVGTFIPVTGDIPIHQARARCRDFGVTHWMKFPKPPVL